MRVGIPYKVIGGTRFYDRREVKDAIAYLRAVVNPADEVSLKRIVNVPKRGVGDTQRRPARRVGARARGHVRRRAAGRRAGRASAARRCRASSRSTALLDELARARRRARSGPAARARSSTRTGYVAELEAEHTIEAAGPAREPRRARRLRPASTRPSTSSSSRSASSPTPTRSTTTRSKVVLMTLHTAKGLEFPVGVPDRPGGRRLPAPALARRARRARGGAPARVRRHHPRPRAALPHPRLEPQLFGTTQYNPPSRFLDEIPEHAHRAGRGWATEPARAASGRGDDRDRRTPAMRAGPARPAAAHGRRAGWACNVGDDVVHGKWGEGVILEIIGERRQGRGQDPLSQRRREARAARVGAAEEGATVRVEVTDVDVALRLLAAVGLGGAIGLERELSDQPAGLRTHITVALGAALFGVMQRARLRRVRAAAGQQQLPDRRDPGRLTGGGGCRVPRGRGPSSRRALSIRGLTTAASLWATAAIGLAVGLGSYLAATIATALLVLSFVGLRAPRRWTHQHLRRDRELLVIHMAAGADPSQVISALASIEGLEVRSLSARRREDSGDRGGRRRDVRGRHLSDLLGPIAERDDVVELDIG